MTINKCYFYFPDNRPVAVISKYIPVDGWTINPGFLISINTADGVFELEFGSQKGIILLIDALQELLNTKNKEDISVRAFKSKVN